MILSSVLPADESARPDLRVHDAFIDQLNQALRSIAAGDARLTYVDNTPHFFDETRGQLDPSWHIGDGVHLNAAGYDRWAGNLRIALEQGQSDLLQRSISAS